jgi:hypothetical protein
VTANKGSYTLINIVGKQFRKTICKQISSEFLPCLQKQIFDVSCFPLEMTSKTASADVFLNTASVYRELPPRQVFTTWTSANTFKRDILQPIICSNTSKSVGVILAKFLKPAPSSTFKSAKRLSPYLVPPLRKCLRHRISFNRNIYPAQIPATRHDVWNWLISGMSERETVFVGVYKPFNMTKSWKRDYRYQHFKCIHIFRSLRHRSVITRQLILTSWFRVLPQKLRDAQSVRKFSAFM